MSLTFLDIPLFDIEPPAPVESEFDRKIMAHAETLEDGSVRCGHCGDIESNETVFRINHSKVFNGWCSRRLFRNNRAWTWAYNPNRSYPESVLAGQVKETIDQDVAWLSRRGWTPQDSHKETIAT